MRHLYALSLSLCVMACSTSSPPPAPAPSQALQAAEAKVDQQLSRPAPAARLAQCQDGSTPLKTDQGFWCPPPQDVVTSLQTDTLQNQVATLIGALQREVDLRFQLLQWVDGPDFAPLFTPPPPAPPN